MERPQTDTPAPALRAEPPSTTSAPPRAPGASKPPPPLVRERISATQLGGFAAVVVGALAGGYLLGKASPPEPRHAWAPPSSTASPLVPCVPTPTIDIDATPIDDELDVDPTGSATTTASASARAAPSAKASASGRPSTSAASSARPRATDDPSTVF